MDVVNLVLIGRNRTYAPIEIIADCLFKKENPLLIFLIRG